MHGGKILPNYIRSTEQFSGEDLDRYVRRFYEKVLDSYDPVDEEVLVNACLHGMFYEYLIVLENLALPSFSRPMEGARRRKESVKRTSKPSPPGHANPVVRPFLRKRLPLVVAVEKGEEARPSNLKKPSYM